MILTQDHIKDCTEMSYMSFRTFKDTVSVCKSCRIHRMKGEVSVLVFLLDRHIEIAEMWFQHHGIPYARDLPYNRFILHTDNAVIFKLQFSEILNFKIKSGIKN
jgi:hypothetical protein